MPSFIRVRDRATGHEFDVAAGAFNGDTMTKVNASRQYPDLTGDRVYPRPAKVRTDKAGQPATSTEEI